MRCIADEEDVVLSEPRRRDRSGTRPASRARSRSADRVRRTRRGSSASSAPWSSASASSAVLSHSIPNTQRSGLPAGGSCGLVEEVDAVAVLADKLPERAPEHDCEAFRNVLVAVGLDPERFPHSAAHAVGADQVPGADAAARGGAVECEYVAAVARALQSDELDAALEPTLPTEPRCSSRSGSSSSWARHAGEVGLTSCACSRVGRPTSTAWPRSASASIAHAHACHSTSIERSHAFPRGPNGGAAPSWPCWRPSRAAGSSSTLCVRLRASRPRMNRASRRSQGLPDRRPRQRPRTPRESSSPTFHRTLCSANTTS